MLAVGISTYSQGNLQESLKIKSKSLNKTVEYSVYLPQDYDQSNRKYPVLYLLHGYSDDETGWTQFGEVKKIGDALISDLEVTDMIIAMPDAGLDFYFNSYDGKIMYEDFFFKEFIPHIETQYRVRAEKQFRAVAGLSMGGHGAMLYAFKHPDMFAAVGALSAAVLTREFVLESSDEEYNKYLRHSFGERKGVGEERITAYMKANNPLFMLENDDVEPFKTVKYYIDCGDDDFLIKNNMELHALMLDKKIPHEFRVRDGDHNWTYWRTALPEVLKFISSSFHR